MTRDVKPAAPSAARSKATVEIVAGGDAALVNVTGLVDERFSGFGQMGAVKTLVINVAEITRMTSFGVRQWLKGMDALPKTVTDLYLLGCPTFFVDQLNMVLNFGGSSEVLTVVAPYTCPSCGVESGEVIDVLAERANLAKGGVPEKECARCGAKLEFDETPESYFSFVSRYGATSIAPAAAQLLAGRNLYRSVDVAAEKPPRIIKLVQGSVTYFRIIGVIGALFRARPFLVGAEGEIVLDLADVERFDSAAQNEWRRLLKSLTTQVAAVTLVDVGQSLLATAGDTIMLARNITVASALVPYTCTECGHKAVESESMLVDWPREILERACMSCGGIMRTDLPEDMVRLLHKASASVPHSSAKVVEQRKELVAKAVSNANASQSGDSSTAAAGADDAILGKYKIVRRLSEAGSVEVFLAKQVGIGGFEKPVALKRIQRKLLETQYESVDSFLSEAKVAGRLTHPNIVQVLDIGEVQDALYLAMEYVNGIDLLSIIKQLESKQVLMPIGEACFVVREIAQALDHAYWSADMTGKRLSVVHRHLAPNKVMLSYDGAVKVLDFGVMLAGDNSTAAQYVAPEAANGMIDHRSDLYSLGVILYQLCSGTTPFSGYDKKRRSGRHRAVHEVADIPAPLAALVERLLSPNPDDRPQRAQELGSELTEIARSCGIESSGPRVSAFLGQLYPDMVRAPAKDPVADAYRTRGESLPGMGASSGSLSFGKSMSGAGIDSSVALSVSGARSSSVDLQPPPRLRPSKVLKTVKPEAPTQSRLSRPVGGRSVLLVLGMLVLVLVVIYFIARG